MYFIGVSFCWLSAAQPAHWIIHPIVVGQKGNRQQSQSFLSIPRAAPKGNDAPAPADPRQVPSHTKHGPPEAVLASDTDPHGRSAQGDNWRVPRAPEGHR